VAGALWASALNARGAHPAPIVNVVPGTAGGEGGAALVRKSF